MKTTHITKVLAVVLSVVMLLGMVPSTVLPVFASNATEDNIFANLLKGVVQGKNTVYNSEKDVNALPEFVNPALNLAGYPMVDKTYSPYEPYSTDNEEHPFLPPVRRGWTCRRFITVRLRRRISRSPSGRRTPLFIISRRWKTAIKHSVISI